jgi:hypothetical protein
VGGTSKAQPNPRLVLRGLIPPFLLCRKGFIDSLLNVWLSGLIFVTQIKGGYV